MGFVLLCKIFNGLMAIINMIITSA